MREMKDSDIPWIGEIPKGWEVERMRYIFSFGKGLPITKENLVDEGVAVISYGQIHAKWYTHVGLDERLYRYVNNSYLQTNSSSLVQKGDFLFADTSEDLDGCGNNVYVDDNILLFAGYHTIILKSKISLPNRYLAYLFQTDCWRSQIRTVTNGIKVFSVTKKILADCTVILPPTAEQQAIADFLDAKCAEIDSLSADIQTQIDTLTQYKKSVITEAVTKGLNPDAEMKDSGIPWIGEIPKGWETDKLKFHLHRNEPRNPGDKIVLSLYREYGVVVKDSRDDNYNVTSEDTSKYKYVQIGDFVVNKMKAWQGSVAVSNYEGIVSPAYFVYKFTDQQYYKPYFHYLLRSCYQEEFRRLSGGIRVGQWDLPSEELDNTPILLPPLAEQQAIADFLDAKCAEIDGIISSKQEQLSTLAEYKKSLIYEYVTGKKEVPTE